MLDVAALERLAKIFKERGLPLDAVDDMVALFNYQGSPGQELLFELLSNFEVCEFDQYKVKGRALAQAMVDVQPPEFSKVILMPVLDKLPASKSKSGDAVAWVMSRSLEKVAVASGRSFDMASQTISAEIMACASCTSFFLVDDYIGSGKTAHFAVSRLLGQGVAAENITVGAFVGMGAAEELLAPTGVRTVFLSKLLKGISDAPGIVDKESALNVMGQMERRMKIRSKYRLGYERSEALALMCFCPNNTFPVFWWKGPTWTGVFER